jgi:PKD repeat protein
MGGPVYRYSASSTSPVKFPQSLDGKYFAGEYGRKWIKTVTVNTDGSAGLIEPFPWSGTQVMDLAFGPDGALYVLDYGTGSNNAGLYRIEYIAGGNRAPIAFAAGTPTSGTTPLTVAFSSAGSSDPEGGALTYAWAFGDGTTSTAANPSKTYTANGSYVATLTVRDSAGLTGTASVPITVGNTAPTVTLVTPASGQLFSFGDTIRFKVNVSDPQDGTIDCARVKVTYSLGHDAHAHSITSKTGCSGTITIPVDGEHDATANIYGVFDAEYTDNGGATTHSIRSAQPRHRQAEHWSSQSGVQVADHAPAEGGRTAGFIENGDWMAFNPYLLTNATSFTARVSSAGSGGTLQVRAGSATGTLLGSVNVASTGGWETFANVSANLATPPAGTTTLYAVFTGGTGYLFDVDAFTLNTAVEGENYTSTGGVQLAAHDPASAAATAGHIETGDWAGYSTLNVAGKTKFTARVSSGGAGGTIQIRSGSQTGPVLGTVNVANTGGWENFQTVSANLTAGTGQLFLTFTGGTGALLDIDFLSLS